MASGAPLSSYFQHRARADGIWTDVIRHRRMASRNYNVAASTNPHSGTGCCNRSIRGLDWMRGLILADCRSLEEARNFCYSHGRSDANSVWNQGAALAKSFRYRADDERRLDFSVCRRDTDTFRACRRRMLLDLIKKIDHRRVQKHTSQLVSCLRVLPQQKPEIRALPLGVSRDYVGSTQKCPYGKQNVHDD